MSKNDNYEDFSDSRLNTPFLMGRVWFNCNQVLSRFGFIFSNPKRVRDGFGHCYSRPVPLRLYFKNIFYYFILYFNINNNNNYNVF